MGILSWIQAKFRRAPDTSHQQKRQRLLADLRKLTADAETLRAKNRALRQRIGAALSEDSAGQSHSFS